MSLNSQFTIVLNDLICFSVRSCDNSLFVLKCFFRSFLLQAKRYKGFPVTKKCYCRCNHFSFIYETVSQFFEILIFSQNKIFGETFIMSVKSTTFPKELWSKPLISRAKQIKFLSEKIEVLRKFCHFFSIVDVWHSFNC